MKSVSKGPLLNFCVLKRDIAYKSDETYNGDNGLRNGHLSEDVDHRELLQSRPRRSVGRIPRLGAFDLYFAFENFVAGAGEEHVEVLAPEGDVRDGAGAHRLEIACGRRRALRLPDRRGRLHGKRRADRHPGGGAAMTLDSWEQRSTR